MSSSPLRRFGAGAVAAAFLGAAFCSGIVPASTSPAFAENSPSVDELQTPPTTESEPQDPAPSDEETTDPGSQDPAAPSDPATGNQDPGAQDPTDQQAVNEPPSTADQQGQPAEGEAPAPPVSGTAGNAARHWPLAITEINGDNVGEDLYEYIEVTNTTDQPIDLDAQGIQLRYHTSQWNTGTVQPIMHLAGEADSPVVIPAGGVAVFWMNYAEGDKRQALTKQQFREFYGADENVQVFRFGPQAGFANGGNRGFSLTDATGKTLSRAWVPSDDGVSSTHWNAQFGVPDLIGSTDARLMEYDITGATAQPTPGTITQEQVTSRLEKPTDPGLGGPILQITELAPDTANVGGADAFEFIEVYNASNAPVNFGDYVLNYLTTDNDLKAPTTLGSTLWPAGPSEPTIEPGGTLVVWIQNPQVLAAGYDAARFNAEFGTSLELGKNLLTVNSAGMANGGSRGLQLMTKSGHDVSRAYYFNDAQTTPTTAIQYAWNPGAAAPMWAPADQAGTTQTMLGLDQPTPGAVSESQIASAYVPFPAAGTAPVIADLTAPSTPPVTDNLALAFNISDDTLVRRVTLTVTDNLGKSETKNLAFTAGDSYTFSIPQADLYGKQWIEYQVTASDGHQTSTHGPVRIALRDGALDPVRVNVADGQFVTGETPLVATAEQGTQGLTLSVDGTPVADTVQSLERAPKFAIEATATDAFFRNGIKLGDNVLRIFDEGYYDKIVTVDADVPVGDVIPGEPLTLGVYAGTKAWPTPDVNENNDDFTMMNPRLALPDGRVLTPSSCQAEGEVKPLRDVVCPQDAAERINLTDNDLVVFYATFTIPQDAFNSVAHTWDSTTVADGEHLITAASAADPASGAPARAASRTILVDNTAPVITSDIEEAKQYRGPFTIDAAASDEGSGLASVHGSLDGTEIALPHDTSSLTLAPGDHSLVITATDAIGNISTRTIAFTTADEKPRTTLTSPADGAELTGDEVRLEAMPESNVDDKLKMCFVEGYSFTPEQSQVTAASGTTTDSRTTDRSGATPMSEADLKKLVGTDGINVTESSATELPYQVFTVDVPKGAARGADARVKWDGSANANAKVLLYVLTTAGTWEEVDRHVTTGGAPTEFTLDAQVPVDGHAKDEKLTFLVQHSEGWAATNLTTRDSQVTPFHPGATPRSAYDFTLAWESDTQYYNKNEGQLAGTGGADNWYQHQLKIHDFVLNERENLNIQYMLHTGDIVDNFDQDYQWQNADAAYDKLDAAGLPYGVLAGNHDVGHFDGDYTNYGTYFGESRFSGNPWYGGSYKNNRGHFDLVSANGVDLLMLYMGWPDPNNEASNSADIAWMNEVIKQYPERKVMINLHEYMLTTGGLGPFPQRIYDEVVGPNSNVIAVGSGHYHDAYTRQDAFDDDGDGAPDRTVYSMLFDYQGLPEGGQGFLRLLHFDNENGKILVRTYSPSREVFNSEEPSLNSPEGMQEFEIPYAAGGITSTVKTLATDSFTADILTDHRVECVENVTSGTAAGVTWKNLKAGEHSWFVQTTGPYGGVEYSEVRSFSVTGNGNTGGGDGDNGGDSGGSDHGGGDGGGNPGDGNTGGGTGGGTHAGGNGTLSNTGGASSLPFVIGGIVAALAGAAALFVTHRRSVK